MTKKEKTKSHKNNPVTLEGQQDYHSVMYANYGLIFCSVMTEQL